MRRIFFSIIVALCAANIGSAQIISTSSNSHYTSKQIVTSQQYREGGNKYWFMKLGVNYSGLQCDDDYTNYDIDRSLGYDLEIGMNKQIARSPFYYGLAFGFCSNLGSSYTDSKDSFKNQLKSIDDGDQQHNFYISPINIGLRLNFGISLDISGGAFYTLEYLPDLYHDYGVNANAGLWLGKFYLGVSAQRGLRDRAEDVDINSAYLSNVMFRLGFSF